MAKTVKVVHIIATLVFTLYSGLAVVGYGLRLINPSNHFVRYWRPGVEVAVGAVAFTVLLGILLCSSGMMRGRASRLLRVFSVVWVVCFTWFAWAYDDSPFRLHELVGVDLGDPLSIQRAERVHFVQAAVVYLLVLVLTVVPIYWPSPLPGSGTDQRRRSV